MGCFGCTLRLARYHASVGQNSVLELDFAVDRTGRIDPVHAARYAEVACAGVWHEGEGVCPMLLRTPCLTVRFLARSSSHHHPAPPPPSPAPHHTHTAPHHAPHTAPVWQLDPGVLRGSSGIYIG